MILQTHILFDDEETEGLGLEKKFLWFKGTVDLNKTTAWHEFVHKNKAYPYTSVHFDNGYEMVVKCEYEHFCRLMDMRESMDKKAFELHQEKVKNVFTK